jgi:hypothetical protein
MNISDLVFAYVPSGDGNYHQIIISLMNFQATVVVKNVERMNICVGYKLIIFGFCVVLYGCETWSLTLSGEQRLRVFEIRVLRRIFGPKRDEVTGEWRRLHNEELNDLYSSPNIILVIKSRRMRWAGHVARMGKREVHTGFW